MNAFFGLNAFQIFALIAAGLTLLLLIDAFVGHYRSGFVFRSQFAPFASGGLLVICAVAASIFPNIAWLNTAMRISAWLAIISGVAGFGFHHFYGMAKKPGGYGWFLHYLMYGAPQFAPVALSATGFLALVASYGLAGESDFAGVSFRGVLFGFVAVALLGAIVQAGILHYRGAFNNPLMYAPLTAPLLAVCASAWMAFAPENHSANIILSVLLWLTFLIGFVGLGMHLRGLERQMGGLYLWRFNLLEGAPVSAPAFFSGLTMVGLATIYLLK
jgi:hypothetical protein